MKMDVLKGQLAAVLKSQTRFGLIQFVVSIVSWTTVIGLTFDVYAKDKLAFTCSCDEDKESTAYNRRCYGNYAKQYSEPLSQVYFALISGCGLVGSWIIYAICMAPRLHHFQQNRRQAIGRSCCSAYFCYLLEVLLRICFTGAMVTVYFLEQRESFPDVFPCRLVSGNITNHCKCYDVYSTEKRELNSAMLVINAVLCFLSLVEMVYMIIILRCSSRFRLARHDPFQDPVERNGCNLCSMPTDQQFINLLLNESPDGNLQPTEDMNDGQPRIREFSMDLKSMILQRTEKFSNAFTLDGFNDLPGDKVYTQTLVQHGRAKYSFHGKRRHDILQRYPDATTPGMTLEKFADSCVSRPVLVIGRAGIGKTVFSLKMLREWAKGIFLKKFRFVFLLNFRQLNLINNKQMINLNGLLALSPYSPALEDRVFRYMLWHPKQVLVIFDGLDEFKHYKLCLTDEKRFHNRVHLKMSIPALYAKLTMGKILPGAAVITTTRPAAVACVVEIYSDVSTFEIMGFTTISVQCYLDRYFDHHKDLKRIISEYIFSNANILSLCYIPVCCMIICSYLKFVCSGHTSHDHEIRFDSLPHTLTEIYNGVLKMFITKHSPEYHEKPLQELTELSQCAQETVQKLSLLAFTTLKMSKLIFRIKDFAELGLEQDIQVLVNSGLIHCMPGCRTGPVTFENQYCFVHLTLQEFLAGRKIALSLSEDEFIEFIQSPHLFSKWELVVQFVAGLLPRNTSNCSALTNKLFERLHGGTHSVLVANGDHDMQDDSAGSLDVAAGSGSTPSYSSLTPPRYSRSSSCHSEYLPVTSTQNDGNSSDISSCSTPSLLMSFDERRCQSDLLLLEMKCVYEQQDTHRASQVAARIGKYLDLSGIQLSDVDIYAAVFFTFKHAATGILKDMSLFNNHIRGLGCTKLAELLCYGLGPSKSLNLDSNDVGDEGVESLADAIKHFECTLEKLNLNSNGLSRVAVGFLSDAIMHPNCNLYALDIGYNKIGRSSLVPLGKALTHPNCNITHLDLPHSGIGNEDCEILAHSLKHNNCQLIVLNIQNNRLISCDGMVSLVSSLSKCDCKLESLNLGSTECSEDEMKIVCNELAHSLICGDSKLKSLSLCSSKINDDSLCKLMEAVENPQCKLVCLDLGGNLIGDEGCHHVVNALCSPGCGLNYLKLQQNRIGDKGAGLFTCVFESQSFKLESLDLSCNNISRDAQISLLNAWGELRGGLTLI